MLVLGDLGQDADLGVGQVGVGFDPPDERRAAWRVEELSLSTMRLGLCTAIASTARSASVSAKTMICRPTPGSTLSVVMAMALAITTTGGSAIRSSLSADPAADSKSQKR